MTTLQVNPNWSRHEKAGLGCQTFAQNLDRLFKTRGLGRKTGAEAMGLPYKWLRRAVTHGVGRQERRNAEFIRKIGDFFGLASPTDLWRDDLIEMRLKGREAPSIESAQDEAYVDRAALLLGTAQAAELRRLIDRLSRKAGLSDVPNLLERQPDRLTHDVLIKWPGTKKKQAAAILNYFPPQIETYYEPFIGSGAVLLTLLMSKIVVRRYVASDIYAPLVALWNLIKSEPNRLIAEYARLWKKLRTDGKDCFYSVRDSFNETHDPCQLFFLVRTSKNGYFRFNGKAEFMGSFRLGRFGSRGTRPDHLEPIVRQVSQLLREKQVEFQVTDYRAINSKPGDLLYLDPPYSAVERNIYPGRVDYPELFRWLRGQKGSFLMSLDRADRTSVKVPTDLYDQQVHIGNGVNPFQRLFEQTPATVHECLYIGVRRRISRRMA